jgi:sugar phosphate isomerase/epimerase
MCPGTLVSPGTRDPDVIERSIRASAKGGFESVSLWTHWARVGGLRSTRSLLEDVGISARALEAAMQWGHGPADAAQEAQLHLEAARALDVDLVQAALLSPTLDMPRAVDGFAALCEEVRAEGIRVSIEFVPWLAVPDLETAWAIVTQSGADNGGICIDMLHWQRQPGGPNFDLLAEIPGDRIFYVQVCDAGPVAPTSAEDYLAEAMNARAVPGEGTVDIPALLAALEAIGARPYLALEVFNERLRSTGPEAMAERLHAATSAVLA